MTSTTTPDEPQSAALSPAAPSASIQQALELSCLAAKIADDYRGSDTVVLDLTGVTPMFDFFVISTGTSQRQMRSLAEEINRVLKSRGTRSNGVEGDVGSPWLLHDYGDIVVHVLSPEARQLYNLEELWADAKQVDWKPIAATLELPK
jgi:ribosome-associated protein